VGAGSRRSLAEEVACPALSRRARRRRSDIEIFAFVETRDFSEFLAIQEDLNLRIKEIVEASGTAFAFPSQTLYVERSHGLDADLARAAETEVERWRSEGRLPFPDYDDRARRELSNTLDYPPEGSAGHASSGRP
jgi:MscS family membrane protein